MKILVFILGLFCCTATWAACPDGYTSVTGGDSIDDCYMEIAPGYYWTVTAVELCPAEHACAGGNMPYADRVDEWGIVGCSGNNFLTWPTSYLGMTHCGCPVDPLDNIYGNYNESLQKTCWKPGVSGTENIGVNEYTAGTANCYWNGTNYAVGGDNWYGCDNYTITACAAGYYAPIKSNKWRINCVPVESGYYSPEGDTAQTPCTNSPENARYTGGGTANDCPWECDDGYGLHDGACVPLCAAGMQHIKTGNGLQFNLYPVAYSTPALHVKQNETVCHAVLAPGAAKNAININHNGQIYHTVD